LSSPEAAGSGRIEILSHRAPAVAAKIHAVLMLAYAQEAQLLEVQNFPPLEQTAADIQASDEFFLGSFDGHELLGVISVHPDDEPGQINIASLVVHPSHQRRGVAGALLTNALQRAAGATFSVSTAAKNTPALALYAKFGFEPYRWGTIGDEGLALVKLRRAPQPR
jgi:ribosomal protein S18 acetylase RimI-like enzyme